MIVSSYGSLQSLSSTPGPSPWPSGSSLSLYGQYRHSYATLYRTQPNVRTCVDFFARNIAQLGLHVFRRVSDTDRQRLRDHGLAVCINNPNPSTTRYRLIETTVQDFCVYWNAFWLKVRVPNRLGLVRLPAGSVSVNGGLLPTEYVWTSPNGEEKTFAPSEIVHFRGYDPLNPLAGLSPLETLRRILAEEAASGDFRERFWRGGAHLGGVIERPLNARWAPDARDSWIRSFRENYAGNGANVGGVPVLEDGMTFKPLTSSAKDAEYLQSRKLTREECARAYHIPLPMVGILDHATFSNIKEQHKNLYQDTLGPPCVMMEEDIELQLLTEFSDREGVYCEHNIHEKLRGSFEEEAGSLMALTGGAAVMTQNEARARLNLPRIEDPDADKLIQQANITGAQESPQEGPKPERSQDTDEDEDEDEDNDAVGGNNA